MILYAIIVGRLYYAGERQGTTAWVDDRDGCMAFDSYAKAEALRRKWIRSARNPFDWFLGRKKPHHFADIVNVVAFPADWLQSPV